MNRKLFLFTMRHQVRIGNKTLKRFQADVFGWDALESNKSEPDKKNGICQTIVRKMVKKVLSDCVSDFPHKPEGYPGTVCARDIIETVAEIADQFKSNPCTANSYVGLRKEGSILETQLFAVTIDGFPSTSDISSSAVFITQLNAHRFSRIPATMKMLLGADVKEDDVMITDWFDNKLAPVVLGCDKFPEQNVITGRPGFKKDRSYPYNEEVQRSTYPLYISLARMWTMLTNPP